MSKYTEELNEIEWPTDDYWSDVVVCGVVMRAGSHLVEDEIPCAICGKESADLAVRVPEESGGDGEMSAGHSVHRECAPQLLARWLETIERR